MGIASLHPSYELRTLAPAGACVTARPAVYCCPIERQRHECCMANARYARPRTEVVMLITPLRFSALLAGVAAASLSFAAKAADVIKIGAPLALTGSVADEAHKQDVVWKMWLAKVNGAGGIDVAGKKMKVELVIYDYQSDGQRAGQLAEKLVTDDKVDFLLAPFGS